jgi:hypothetical protein
LGSAGRSLHASAGDDRTPDIDPGSINVTLSEMAGGLDSTVDGVDQIAPTDMAPLNDGTGRQLVMTLGGVIRVMEPDGSGGLQLQSTPYHSFRSDDSFIALGAAGPTTIAPHPDFADNGKFYTVETEQPDTAGSDTFNSSGDLSHYDVLYEYTVNDPSADQLTAGQFRKNPIMRIRQPRSTHNAHDLTFDAQNNLLISIGDGGNSDATNGEFNRNAQDLSPDNPLGKILRIDPSGSDGRNGQYGIPSDNPFAADGDGKLDEAYTLGHRNPYRLTRDRKTGELYVGDVGQLNIEEINRVVAGGNYGWNLKEGNFLFNLVDDLDENNDGRIFEELDEDGDGQLSDESLDVSTLLNRPNERGTDAQNTITPDVDRDGDGQSDFSQVANLEDPLLQYDHEAGLSVTGGFVYRPEGLTSALSGQYVLADFIGDPTDSSDVARLFYAALDDQVVGDETGAIREITQAQIEGAPLPNQIFSIAQDEGGQLYLLGESRILKLTPNDLRVPEPASMVLLAAGFGTLLSRPRRPAW